MLSKILVLVVNLMKSLTFIFDLMYTTFSFGHYSSCWKLKPGMALCDSALRGAA